MEELKQETEKLREGHSKLGLKYDDVVGSSESKKDEILILHEKLIEEQLKLQKILLKEKQEAEDMKNSAALEKLLFDFNKLDFICIKEETWTEMGSTLECYPQTKSRLPGSEQLIRKAKMVAYYDLVQGTYMGMKATENYPLSKGSGKADQNGLKHVESCNAGWANYLTDRHGPRREHNTEVHRKYMLNFQITELNRRTGQMNLLLKDIMKILIHNIKRIDTRMNEIDKKIEKTVLLNNEKIAEVFGEQFLELETKLVETIYKKFKVGYI